MNKLSTLLIACAITLATQSAGWCDNMIERTYDWIAEIETQQMEKSLEYQGSALTPIVRARVNYFATDKPTQITSYEDLWYSNGRPYGLERKNAFTVTPGDQIAIRIKHKDPSAGMKESRAATNAALRVMLDAMLNRNMVAAILVPQSSYSSVYQSLQEQNCAPMNIVGEAPMDSSIDIFLKAEPSGPSQMFRYTR